MTNYLIRRSLAMLVVLLVSTMAIFMLLTAAPGGPLDGLRMRSSSSRDRVSTADIERLEKMLGLDKPGYLRYIVWLVGDDWMPGDLEGDRIGVLRGDWGESWKVAQSQNVSMLVKSRLMNTITLMGASLVLSLVVAIPIGIYSAVRQYSKIDYLVTMGSFIGLSMPVFWFGIMLIILFGLKFKEWGLPYLPAGGVQAARAYTIPVLGTVQPGSPLDHILHLIMPTIVLSLLYMAGWSRFTRTSMLEVMRQDYVRTARAKGLFERIVITKHALRNALIPIITIVGLQLPSLFTGAIMTETVFAYPGMGRLYFNAMTQSDWPVVMAILFITAILVVVCNLGADMAYAVADPRIRYE
ncbi:ABC transporter permease [Chloroflexota bacterium]